MSKHIHKYVRMKLGSKGFTVYKCLECSHFVPEKLIIGREARCARCDQPFIVTKELMFRRPHCKDCIKRKTSDVRILEGINKILNIKI